MASVHAIVLSATSALAVDVTEKLEVIGKPVAEGFNFQRAVTDVARDLVWLDNMLMYIGGAICIFVLGLLLFVILRFNSRMNPKPATFTHNTAIEFAWTIIPVLILVFIGILSLPILFKQQIIPEADITIKATGNQWYWTYEYMDHDFSFDSFMVAREDLESYGYAEDEYLLASDTPVVLPVGKTVVVHVTASDVIHAWTVPAFGVKQDGVPGRLAGLWFTPEVEGVYFGQCSELCGKDHSYMPITVKIVSQEVYEDWLGRAVEEYASLDIDEGPVRLAMRQPAEVDHLVQ